MLLTRRQLLIGAAGVAAVAAVGVGAVAATSGGGGAQEAANGLSVPESSVVTTDTMEYIEDANSVMGLATSVALPYGTMLWASDDDVAACLLPTDTGSPLAQVGLLALGSGNLSTVLNGAVGQNEGYQIFDVRATSQGVVWTESDILDGTWRIYQAPQSGNALGAPTLVAEGGADWEMPALVAVGGWAFWQLMPAADGPAAKEESSLMRVAFGGTRESAAAVLTSKGRFACSPSASATGVACCARVPDTSSTYCLTHVDAATGDVTDKLELPSSMVPDDVAYGPTGFSFCFDAIYSYGDGIANLGTYTPVAAPALDYAQARADAVAAAEAELPEKKADEGLTEQQTAQAETRAENAVADLYSTAQWLRFPRTPVEPPAWCGPWFVVKSTSAVAGVDAAGMRYFTIPVENGAPDYGEFLASSGAATRLVTYTQIDYTPIAGDPVKECRVKVWKVL